MVILCQGKPITEEKSFGEREIYDGRFIDSVLDWLSPKGIRVVSVKVIPDEDMIVKVTNLGNEVPLRKSSINYDPRCRGLHLLYRPDR